jgi:hypothetical protein
MKGVAMNLSHSAMHYVVVLKSSIDSSLKEAESCLQHARISKDTDAEGRFVQLAYAHLKHAAQLEEWLKYYIEEYELWKKRRTAEEEKKQKALVELMEAIVQFCNDYLNKKELLNNQIDALIPPPPEDDEQEGTGTSPP